MTAAQSPSLRARFAPHPRGYGFLTPVGDDGLAPTAVSLIGAEGEPITVDRIFAAPPLARGLVADDLVAVTATLGEKGAAAQEIALLERPRRLLQGTLARRGEALVLEPDGALAAGRVALDDRLRERLGREHVGEQLVVLAGAGEDGAPIAQALVAGPHRPGSPEAIRARTVVLVLGGQAPSLVPGGAVAVGLDPREAETTHLRLLGQLAEGRRGAAAGRERAGPIPGAGLAAVDRRDEPCVTIDAAGARDLDDAVWAGWDGDPRSPVHLAVHIADAAAAVGADSEADRYARTVGASTYPLAGESAPMLDPALSEAANSLQVGQERSVLSVRCAVAADGTVRDVAIEPATICSRAQLSYGAVEQWLAGEPRRVGREARSNAEIAEGVLGPILEAARRLGVERDARLTLEELFESPTLTPVVRDGELRLGAAEPHAEAYRLVERLMVAANEAVGAWLVAAGVPALYRAHEGIDPQRRARLHAAAELAGAQLPALDAEHGDPDRVAGELLAEIDRLAAEGRQADRDLLVAAATAATARARYEPDPAAHRGLAAGAYCHFTSPLRRYADLVVHRQVRAALAGETPPTGVDELRALGEWLAAHHGALSRFEARERADLWGRLLEQGQLDGVETATVTGLTPAGARLRLPRLGLTGFLRAEALLGLRADERATLAVDDHGLTTTSGPWRVGSRLEVAFAGLDERGRVEWALADARP